MIDVKAIWNSDEGEVELIEGRGKSNEIKEEEIEILKDNITANGYYDYLELIEKQIKKLSYDGWKKI